MLDYLPYILILVVFIIFLFLYINLKQKQKIKTETIKILEKHGKVSIKNKHLLFYKEDRIYEILFYKIAMHHELTINSKIFWEIHTKAGSQLINQTSFLSSHYQKIIILYPITTKIKRFINENEMVFVDYHDVFFNMRLVKFDEIKDFFSEVEL
jgi:hypothetical protein